MIRIDRWIGKLASGQSRFLPLACSANSRLKDTRPLPACRARESRSYLWADFSNDDFNLLGFCIIAWQNLWIAQALVFWQDFLSEVGAVDSPGRGIQSPPITPIFSLRMNGSAWASSAMEWTQSSKAFGGSLVDAPDVSDLRDGPDLFFDRVIGNLANEAWIMLGIDVQRNLGLRDFRPRLPW